MSISQTAGGEHYGRFCRKCDQEIQATDRILVDEDAETDEYGGWRDLTTVEHVKCPEEA